MNKRSQVDPPARVLEPAPRRPHRALLVLSSVVLTVWVLFLVLVALRVV